MNTNEIGSTPLSLRQRAARFFNDLADNEKLLAVAASIVTVSIFSGLAASILVYAMPGAFGDLGAALRAQITELVALATSEKSLFLYGVVAAVIIIDAIFLGHTRSALRSLIMPDKTTRTDIYIFVMGIFGLWRYAVIFSFFLIGYAVEANVNNHLKLNFLHSVSNPLLQTVIYLLVYDFLDYWRHRLGHRISWWWEVHLMHHSAEKFNVITVGRSHPVDLALTGIFVAMPIAILGAPITTFILIEVLRSAQGKLQHSMVDWNWGWLGRYIFISPIAHRIHHSPDPIHWDKNYGHIFVFWDRMFGTWYDGQVINQRVGLRHNDQNQHGFIHDLIRAQLRFIGALFAPWQFKTGVLTDEQAKVESARYRDECKKRQITP